MSRGRDERGYSESVQWAMLTPVAMLLLFGALQTGLWWHGHNVARQAAAAAAEAESAYRAGAGSGAAAARNVAQAGGLHGVDVRVARGSSDVTVVVTASVPLLVDLGLDEVTETASSPMERVP